MSKSSKLIVPAQPKAAQKKAAVALPTLPRAAAPVRLNTLVVPRPPLPKRR